MTIGPPISEFCESEERTVAAFEATPRKRKKTEEIRASSV